MAEPVLITPATKEPISLSELREHLGAPDIGQDSLIARQLARARRQVELLTGIGLASETWEQSFNAGDVTGDRLRLWRSPVTAIVSVTARYADGTTGTMASSGYYVTREYLALASSASWPTCLRTYESLVVRYTAGEAPIEGSPLREAVLKLAAWYYGTRGDQEQGGSIPEDVWDALVSFRPLGIA